MQEVLAARWELKNANEFPELQIFREHADGEMAAMYRDDHKHIVYKTSCHERKPDFQGLGGELQTAESCMVFLIEVRLFLVYGAGEWVHAAADTADTSANDTVLEVQD
jgi:hypothetical protein